MKKLLRVTKLAALLISPMLLIISLGACKEKNKYPKPTEKFFVNDFADVISDADEEIIYNQGVALQEKTKAQAVVVTVDNLDGKDAYEYALELGREWGVGDKKQNNGIVVLFAKEDQEVYIAVGEGLEGALPDVKTVRIIDNYGIPYFSSDEFSKGIIEVYNSVVNEIYIEYDLEVPEGYTPVAVLPETQQESQQDGTKVVIAWVILVVIVALYVGVFGRHGLFIFGAPRFFTGGFHFHGGGGGFGGFKGGGGTFGGGGAGRKF